MKMNKMIAAIMAASMTTMCFGAYSVTATAAERNEAVSIKAESWTMPLTVACMSIGDETDSSVPKPENGCAYSVEDGLQVTVDALNTGEVYLHLSLAKDVTMNSEYSYIRLYRDDISYPAYLYDVKVVGGDYANLFTVNNTAGRKASNEYYGVPLYWNDFFDKNTDFFKKLRDNGGAVPDLFTEGWCYGSEEYKLIPDNAEDGADILLPEGTEICSVKFVPIRDIQRYHYEGKDSLKPVCFDFYGEAFSINAGDITAPITCPSANTSLWYRDTTAINDFDFMTVYTQTNGDIDVTFANCDISKRMQSVIVTNSYAPEWVDNRSSSGYEITEVAGRGCIDYSRMQSMFGSICNTNYATGCFCNEHSHIGTYGWLHFDRTDYAASLEGNSLLNYAEGYIFPDREPYTARDNSCFTSKAEHIALLNFDNTDTGFGDANLDGSIDLSDAVFIMQSVANPDRFQLTDAGRVLADVNDIGTGITPSDALNIQKYLLKLIDTPVTR